MPHMCCNMVGEVRRYVAVTRGVVEVRRKDGGAAPAAAEGGQGEQYVQRTFDLATQEGLAGYWAQLAQMAVDYRYGNTLSQAISYSVFQMHSFARLAVG